MPRTEAAARLPTVADLRDAARRRLPRLVYDFIDGAAGGEGAKARNAAALDDILLMPRVLANVAGHDLAKTFLGTTYRVPFGIAPMGMCDLAGPGTDRAFAAASARADFPIGVSTASSTPLEDMLRLSDGRAWFQLYVSGPVEAADRLIERADAAGYQHLLLTVDVPKLGRRPRDTRNGFSTPFKMSARHFLDFAMHPSWSIRTLFAGAPRMANYDNSPQRNGYDRNAARTGTNWDYLDRLRAKWRKKLIIKGVMSPDDAARIKAAGADAVYVSNHGGRQMDSAPATISALPAIRQAVGQEYPLIVDGGIRSGEDVLKALALGADFVMTGRPFLYASAAAGEAGVAALVANLAAEIEITLAQIGHQRVEDISGSILARG